MRRQAHSIFGFLLSTIVVFGLGLVAGDVVEAQQGPRLQGQVPLEDQESGRSLKPYKKHVKLVGRNDILNRGV